MNYEQKLFDQKIFQTGKKIQANKYIGKNFFWNFFKTILIRRHKNKYTHIPPDTHTHTHTHQYIQNYIWMN